MPQDRRNASAMGGRGPAIGAFVAALAVIAGLAFVVLTSGGDPAPVRPTPVGTAIVAPQGEEIALAQTPSPPPTLLPAETPTSEPAATATPPGDAGPTPTPRTIKATRTPRPASPPTSTPLPNVKVTPSPTANATATARARATATARATKAATPVEVLAPVDSGPSGPAPTLAPAAASSDLPVFEEPAAVPQQPVYQEPVYQEPVYQEPAVDIFATVQAGQAAVRQPEPAWEPPPVVVEIPEIAFPTPWINQAVGPGAPLPTSVAKIAPNKRATAKPSSEPRASKEARDRKDDRKRRSRGDGRPGNNGRGG